MGQKVNPHGFRVGVIKDWDTHWYANKHDFSRFLVEDYKIREFMNKQLANASVSRLEIEREGEEKVIITISTSKPGIVIGRQGSEIDELKKKLNKKFKREFYINVKEVKNPDGDAQIIASNIAQQLEERASFRRAMKQAISNAMKSGVLGIKTMCSGRLGGAEIARTEQYHEGTIPLHTMRADIDYGFCEAHTQYGRLGVKVWVYKGETIALPKNSVEGEA